MSVVSVLRLPVRTGCEATLVRAFAELEIFRHSKESGGFLGGRLLRPLGGGPFLVVAEWESERDYRGWLENPVRETLGAQIKGLLVDDVAAGKLYIARSFDDDFLKEIEPELERRSRGHE